MTEKENFPILYHYCSYNTLLTILQNKTFRLCSIDLMNDYSEIKYGIECLKEIMLEQGFEEEKVAEAIHAVNSNVKSFSETREASSHGSFITCFSSVGDLNIPMWKMYGNDFCGVSIGFDLNKISYINKMYPINSAVAEHHIGCSNVFYNNIKSLLSQRLNSNLACYSNNYSSALLMASISMSSVMPFIKQEYFQYENEYRLVYREMSSSGTISTPHIQNIIKEVFYLKDDSIVKGFELEWGMEKIQPITDIILGPKFKGNEQDLKNYLDRLGYGDVPLKRSQITIR